MLIVAMYYHHPTGLRRNHEVPCKCCLPHSRRRTSDCNKGQYLSSPRGNREPVWRERKQAYGACLERDGRYSGQGEAMTACEYMKGRVACTKEEKWFKLRG